MKSVHHNHPKYMRIMSSAKELFWKHGFKRVSIEEICVKARTSKMTFYRFFANKTELAKAVFDKVVEEGIAQFREILASDSTPAEKVEKMIMMKIEGSHDVSQEFIMDFYSNPELGLKEYIEANMA
jgi:AcrR family transcriptional regulator